MATSVENVFNFSADAPEFVPSWLRQPAAAAAGAGGGAAPVAAAKPRPIIITLDREVRLFPMKAPRLASLKENVLEVIGTRTEGFSEHWNNFGLGTPEPTHYAEGPSPFPCDQPELDQYGEDSKVLTMACHDNDYRLNQCLRSMPGHADPTPEQLGDFPKNIQDYFWICDGKNDERPWRALCRLSTGLFVYIKASCGFSGFDCMGAIHVYAAPHPQTLVEHALTEEERRLLGRIFDGHKKAGAGK
jgi:hypothetical protein